MKVALLRLFGRYSLFAAPVSAAVEQVDDFQDGTRSGWVERVVIRGQAVV